jgi:hypothetical protein
MTRRWASTVAVLCSLLAVTASASGAEERRAATCTDYIALDQNQKMSVAYGYLEGVQAAFDKEPVDFLVPPSDPRHPMWWVLPADLGQEIFTGLAKRLEAHCRSAGSKQAPILEAFLSIAHQREGSPSFGISNDKKRTDPWKKFMGGSVSCSAYGQSSQGTRQAIVYGYYLGTEAVRVSRKSSVNIGLAWPPKLTPQDVRMEVDKLCHKDSPASVREVLWVKTVELGVKTGK